MRQVFKRRKWHESNTKVIETPTISSTVANSNVPLDVFSKGLQEAVESSINSLPANKLIGVARGMDGDHR